MTTDSNRKDFSEPEMGDSNVKRKVFNMTRPDQYMCWLYEEVNDELKVRVPELSEAERAIIVARFVDRFDFDNTASAHKSAGGIADMLISELDFDR